MKSLSEDPHLLCRQNRWFISGAWMDGTGDPAVGGLIKHFAVNTFTLINDYDREFVLSLVLKELPR